jgi:hypothetical protein
MRLNQVTVTLFDLDAGWRFYFGLGLVPIVDARPNYVRLVCPDGGSTFSLQHGKADGSSTAVCFEYDDLDDWVKALKAAGYIFASEPADKPWLWRKAGNVRPRRKPRFALLRRRKPFKPSVARPSGHRADSP